MHFESLVSLSLDTKINNIVSIALVTYMPLLDGWLLKTHSNVVRRENAKLNIKLYLIIYFLFLPTLLIPLSNRLRNICLTATEVVCVWMWGDCILHGVQTCKNRRLGFGCFAVLVGVADQGNVRWLPLHLIQIPLKAVKRFLMLLEP